MAEVENLARQPNAAVVFGHDRAPDLGRSRSRRRLLRLLFSAAPRKVLLP
jgi:hypothetical protein